MPRIQAFQQIYARLEKEQSPRGLVGYQTVFRTQPGISDDEIRHIEERLHYYPTENSPPKQVFFVCPSGNPAVANIVRLPERDSHGRLIALAHCVVVSRDQFLRLRLDPFQIIDGFRFITSLQEALAAGDRQTGHMPPVSIESSGESLQRAAEAARAWKPDELRKVIFLALRTNRLEREGLAVGVVGDPPAILDVLRIAHLVLPAALAGTCSFDTHFVDDKGNACNLLATYCWAAGFPKSPGAQEYVVIDAASRTVNYDARWKPANAYELWLEEQVTRGSWEALAGQKDDVFALSSMLEGASVALEDLERISPELVTALFRRNADRVTKWVAWRLGQHLPPALVARLVDPVGRMESAELYRVGVRGFDRDILLDMLYRGYLAGGLVSPPKEELADLGRMVQGGTPAHLALLHAIWTGDTRRQQAILASLPESHYRRIVDAALAGRSSAALSLFDAKRVETFVAACASAPAGSIPLDQLVAMMVTQGCQRHLGPLAPLLGGLPTETLRRCRRVLKGQPGIPSAFLESLEREWSRGKATGGPLRRIMGWIKPD